MKNVKNLFEEFKKECFNRIINKDFEIIECRETPESWAGDYFGCIKINIDGMEFEFGLNKDYKILDLSIFRLFNYNENSPKELFDSLKQSYISLSQPIIDAKIKQLENRIKLLKNESNIV